MARRQVAPVLSVNLRNPPSGWDGTEELTAMRAELRALLARNRALEVVARAAEAYKNAPTDTDITKQWQRLVRALARLSRAGRAGKGERGGR